MKTTNLLFLIMLLCSSFLFAQSKVTYYVYGQVYDANTKSSYYTKIFPVEVGTEEDSPYILSGAANLATNRLRESFKSYIYNANKSPYLSSQGYYNLTRTAAEEDRNRKMDLDTSGGSSIHISYYFNFYFNKDE